MSQQYTSRTAALKAITIDASKVRIKEKIGAPTYTNVADLINSKVSKKDFECTQIDNASEHSSIWCELDTKATRGDISDAISEINNDFQNKLYKVVNDLDAADDIDSIKGEIQALSDEIAVAGDKCNSTYETSSFTNYDIENIGDEGVVAFTFDYEHIPEGFIQYISLRGGASAYGSNYSGDTEFYLYVEIIKESDDSVFKTYISKDKHILPCNSTRPYIKWKFDTFASPKAGEYLKISASTDGITKSESFTMRITADKTHNHGKCSVIWSGNRWKTMLALAKFEGVFNEKNQILAHTESSDKHLKKYEREELSMLFGEPNTAVFDNNVDNFSLSGAQVKAFILSKKYFPSGKITQITLPSDGTTYTTNCKLVITIKDTRNKIINTVFSDNYCNYGVSATSYTFTFSDLTIPDYAGFLVFETSSDGSSISTSNQIRVKAKSNITNNDGTEATNNTFFTNVLFTVESLNTVIDLKGNLRQNISTTNNINAALRSYVSPLRNSNSYQITSATLGTSGKITRVNFNDLRQIITNPLFNSCTINGDIIMKFPVLETAPAIFNNLTINGKLYLELPNAEDITKITNSCNNSSLIILTKPDDITISIS